MSIRNILALCNSYKEKEISWEYKIHNYYYSAVGEFAIIFLRRHPSHTCQSQTESCTKYSGYTKDLRTNSSFWSPKHPKVSTDPFKNNNKQTMFFLFLFFFLFFLSPKKISQMLTLSGVHCISTTHRGQSLRIFLAPLIPKQNQEARNLTLLVSLNISNVQHKSFSSKTYA